MYTPNCAVQNLLEHANFTNLPIYSLATSLYYQKSQFRQCLKNNYKKTQANFYPTF